MRRMVRLTQSEREMTERLPRTSPKRKRADIPEEVSIREVGRIASGSEGHFPQIFHQRTGDGPSLPGTRRFTKTKPFSHNFSGTGSNRDS